MDFKNIGKEYRPIPFWSWNEKLNTDETARQIGIMDRAGLGGYFMHARGGLQTPYMGEEWFENISVGIEEGRKRGMQAWAYDENGWPSGFGSGSVNGRGLDYQQKYLRCESGDKTNDRTIVTKDGYHFYYDVNPYYVDTLDQKVTHCFIEDIYEPYYKRYGNTFCGFFTDEPQISRNGIPWSFILPEEYKKEYGDELLDKLLELFRPVGDYEVTRVRFWRLVTKLFSENFVKPLYDWCTERGLGFTGHLVCEETLESQLTCNGACMPHYEYFTMPGMDWLGRDITECLTPLAVSSVAHQTGKKEILSETYALCGHNTGFDELKSIAQWQMVNGITKLCQHLEGYSLRGLRKRDYPPAMYCQQPWWEEYSVFNDSMSRIGMLLSEGEVHFDTLLLHNQSTAWALYDSSPDCKAEIMEYNNALLSAYRTLQQKHVLFHFGDEIILERHGRVEGNTLVIGTQRYTRIVIPPHKLLLQSTEKLLEQFTAAGGIVTTADKVEDAGVCSSPMITYTKREFDGFNILYFINNNNEAVTASFDCGSKMLDITTGETLPFYGTYKFDPYGSLVLIDDGLAFPKKGFEKQLRPLSLSGSWQITAQTLNTLTLDTCRVYVDGELYSEKENACDVTHIALGLKRAARIKCEFEFDAAAVPEEAYLVCETPQSFDIRINGEQKDLRDVGYFADSSFRKLAIDGLLHEGTNTVSLETFFSPSPQIYDDIEKSLLFESEKNKLTFDIEFESIYIAGNFSVKAGAEFKKLPRNALRCAGPFMIDKPVEKISLANIEQQGYPFFSGRLTVTKTFDLPDENYGVYFSKKGVNAVDITVNGEKFAPVLWAPFACDISSALHKGTNTVEITLVNNLRNLLGPHHLPEGESYRVCPVHFYRRGCVWTNMQERGWNDEYCLVEFGIEEADNA